VGCRGEAVVSVVAGRGAGGLFGDRDLDLVHGTVRFEMGFPTLLRAGAGEFLRMAVCGRGVFFDRFRIPVITAVLMFVFLPKWIAPYAGRVLRLDPFPVGG